MMDQIKRFKLPLAIAAIYLILWWARPLTAGRSMTHLVQYLKEMVLIMPAIFLLMGLIEAWLPKEKIQGWLGREAGIRGLALAFLLGTLPTGPLYVAFPMASGLLKKGAGIKNIVLFLGAWGALKIPQLMVEAEFLGPAFTLLRFVLTFAVLLLMGVLMEGLVARESIPMLKQEK